MQEREKQIKEMSQIMHDGCDIMRGTNQCRGKDCLNCAAVTCYEKGYRKADEVAREIVTDFANKLKCHSFYMTDAYGEVSENIVTVKAIVEIEEELKKKYTKEE